jgi:hypothetical protein
MLDLAYTALLDFLARLRKSSSGGENVEPRFVPIQGDETARAKRVEREVAAKGDEEPPPGDKGE